VFLPLILLMFLLSRWSGGLVDRYGSKRPLVIGPIIAALGFALLAVPGAESGSYWTTFFPAIVVLGVGMAISVAPLTTTVMSAVQVQQAGIASGINNAVARTAGLLAIALFNLMMLAVFSERLEQRLATFHLPPEIEQALLEQRMNLAGAEVPAEVSDSVRAALKQAIDQSFIDGFRSVMVVAVLLALIGSLTTLVMLRRLD
jgi:MFS family permease